jgi:hypothetical protein
MAIQSAKDDQALLQPEREGHFEEGSIGRACLVTFVASAAATLIICGAIRAPQSPELWHWIQIHSVNGGAKRQGKSASAA